MSTNSRKGYDGERPVELLLHDRYGRGYRPRAGAPHDRGDIGGVPLVVSCKNWGREELSTWVSDVEAMVGHAQLDTGVVWHKKRGVADPLGWYVTTSGRLFLPMLDLWMGQHE